MRKERLATLGQLTGSVAHELRNPLGTIHSSLYMVRELAGHDQRLTRAIERATRNSLRCNQIIDELLDYTRTQPLNLEKVMLREWLENIIDEFENPEHINIVLDCIDGIELKADPERLRRCLVNLISNAVQAFPPMDEQSSGKIEVSGGKNTDRLEIRVRDNGSGIAEEDLEKMLEPLFSTKGFGVGLGLCIVEQIMLQHGGGIEISSQQGEGTTVCLFLPLPDLNT